MYVPHIRFTFPPNPPPQAGREYASARGEPVVKLDILRSLNAERAERRAVIIVTDLASGAQRLVKAADVARDELKDTLEKHLRSGKSGVEETATRTPGLPHGACSAAAPCHHRRGAHQPGAGADGQACRLRRHHCRSAHGLRDPGTLSRMSESSRNGRTPRCRNSTSIDTPLLRLSRTIPRSTIRRSPMRWRATASISGRSAPRRPMHAVSSG